MGKAIGIDLGTTYSCIGVFYNGRVDILINEQGNKTTPSCVAYTSMTRLIGTSAVQQEHLNSANTIYAVKRLIGRKFDDAKVQNDIKDFTYNIINDDGYPAIQVSYKEERKTFTPQEISSTILQRMINLASDHLKGENIKQAVITVPAYFNVAQRQATVEAGQIAGLEVVHIINEPTAAAMAYGYDRKVKNKTILVFDLGGGTHDVSIVEIRSEGEKTIYDVKATSGNDHLGGIDFDKKMVDYFMARFLKKHKKTELTEAQLKSMKIKLRQACEVTKRTLSVSLASDIYISNFSPDGTDLKDSITRSKFEDLCASLFDKCFIPVEKALKDAKMEINMIEDIVLVGGSTRIPKIKEMVKQYFNGKPLAQDINPDEAVAYGAAIKAALLEDSEKQVKDLVLMDIISWSLGIATHGTDMSKMILRNTTIPCSIERIYTTDCDNQESLLVEVYEGEEEKVCNNRELGRFELFEIERAKRGEPNIAISFNLDSNGIMKVFAKDQKTCASASKVIHVKSYTGSMTEDKIKDKRRENKAFLEQDKDAVKRKELQDYLNDYFDEALEAISNVTGLWVKSKLIKFIKTSLEWLEKHPSASIGDLEDLKEEAQDKLEQYIKKAT